MKAPENLDVFSLDPYFLTFQTAFDPPAAGEAVFFLNKSCFFTVTHQMSNQLPPPETTLVL